MPDALAALERMGEYLKTLNQFTLSAATTSEDVLDYGEKVIIGGNITYHEKSPDRLRHGDVLQRSPVLRSSQTSYSGQEGAGCVVAGATLNTLQPMTDIRIVIPHVHSGFVILLIGYLVLIAGNVLEGV